MGLFSFFRKGKQKADSAHETAYVSRSATDTVRQRSQRNTSKNEAKSPDVPENRRARRRLVGAVVLVLAVIIVLPRLFDSKPNPQQQNIALQIPDQAKTDHAIDMPANPQQAINADAPNQNANVTVDNDTEEEVVSSSSSPVANVAPAKPAAPVPSAPAYPNNMPPAAPATPNVAKPAAPVTPPASVAKAPEVVNKPKPVPTPAPAPSKPKKDDAAETARAMAILEGKSTAKPAEKSTSGDTRKFVVQVAALSDPAKVAALRQRLSAAGISSFTQQIKTGSGETTRIRVGPFSGRDAAESMRTKINHLGLNASVMPV